MKRGITAALILAIVATGAIVFITTHTASQPVTSTYFLMDTVLTIKTTGGRAATINKQLYALAQNVENMTSYYKTGSETVKINTAAGKQAVSLTPEYADLLRLAFKVADISPQDKFDIAISPLSSLWGFTKKQFRIPSSAEIKAVLPYTNLDQLVLSGNTARLQDTRARIDLGGIAKGYSLDVMEQYLRTVRPRPREVIVDFGGNLLLYSGGRKNDWKVGIRDPRSSGIVGYVVTGDTFVATSGDYERYFIKNGVRYCHIIDPVTGYPSSLNQSATIFTRPGGLRGGFGDAVGKVFFCSPVASHKHLFDLVKPDGVTAIVSIDAAGRKSTLGPITLEPAPAS